MRLGNDFLLALVVGLAVSGGATAAAAELKFFRIGTGGIAGTYYPIGEMIARAVSSLPDASRCGDAAACGAPGIVGVAETSNGSVANVESMSRGTTDSGFVQSDVAHWAYTGAGIFEGEPPRRNLRAIAHLYRETIHVVARKGAGISRIRDLRGKRVSLDEAGSGTLVDARLVLSAYGVEDDDLLPQYVKPDLAVAKMLEGRLDAYFIVAGYPITPVIRLAESVGAVLVPIDGPEADSLLARFPFFSRDVVPAGVYPGVEETKTLSVGAQWLVDAGVDEALVYEITKAVWSERGRRLLDDGHPKGKEIRLENALEGVSLPLHPGARRFYEEIGLVK